MEQILEYAKTYQEYKAELDTELSKTAEGFVRIGYLLKVARDTNVLTESPYQTVTEFAKAEYGIDKTTVSRFISINDRFSEGGYSDQLKEQFRGYGYSKLALMLSLPDEIIQEISPSYSKAEIQAIKDEVDEEKTISDLEVMMEGGPGQPSDGSSLLNMLIRQLGEDSPELYVQMAGIVDLEGMQEWTKRAKEILAPDAEKQYSVRISGTGRFLVSIRETEDTITVTALRTLEKNCYSYQTLRDAWEEILPICPLDESWQEKEYQNAWEDTYNREYPGKTKVAPVQHSNKPEKTESKPTTRKESKVRKAPKSATKKEETPAHTTEAPPKEPEKPESTSTEAAGQSILEPEEAEQPPKEENQPTPEPENPGKTDTGVELRPGMRVRNKLENPCYHKGIGIVVGWSENFDAWKIQYEDTYGKIINFVPLEVIEEFEVVDTQETQSEEQLPGQIGIEEAIEEAEERKGAISYTEPDIPQAAAGQESALDKEWENEKKEFLDDLKRLNTEGSLLSRNLSQIPHVHIVAFRESLINMAALIEKELLRRGEEF